jgi:hypothetical protein
MTMSAFRSFKVAFLRSSHYVMPCHAQPQSSWQETSTHPCTTQDEWCMDRKHFSDVCVSHSKSLWLVLQVHHPHASTNLVATKCLNYLHLHSLPTYLWY